MASACERVDNLVKDYLLFRGFTVTARALDQEIKHDKDKGLRADKIVEQLMVYVNTHDLQHLREYWAHLNQRFFSRLEQRYAVSIRKLEVSLLKLYVVVAHLNSRPDRIRDFFEKIGPELQNLVEFRDWFAFLFVPNPETNTAYGLYFSRQWQETVQLSLHNFLQVILQAMPVPTLLNFEQDMRRLMLLQEENEALKIQIQAGIAIADRKSFGKKFEPTPIPQPLPDLIYDFSGLADQENAAGASHAVNERQKSSRSRFPGINLPATLQLKRNRGSTTSQAQDSAASGQPQGVNFSQSAVSAGRESEQCAAPQMHHSSSTSSAVALGSGSALNTLSSVAAGTVAVQTGGNVQRASSFRSTETVSQSGDTSAPSGPSTSMRRKPPMPPNISERPDPVPPRIPERSMSVTAQVERSGSKADLTTTGDDPGLGSRLSSALTIDHGPAEPLQPFGDGKQCPFIILSDDEYLEHRSAVTYSRFSISCQHIASIDADGIVKVWKWSPQPCTTATVMSRAPFLSLDWASKSDRWLLLGSQSGQIRLFDIRENKTFREASVESPHYRVNYLSACTNSLAFASCLSTTHSTTDPAGSSGKLALWDMKTVKLECYLPIQPVSAVQNSCVYSSTGKLLLSAGADGAVRVYDLSLRQCIRSWQCGQGSIQTVQFGPQDSSFYAVGTKGLLQEWSLTTTAHPIRQVALSDSEGNSFQSFGDWSSPGGQVFCLNKDKTYLLYGAWRKGVICKVAEGKGSMQRVLDLSSHGDSLTTVDWSPVVDTPVCLTGAKDGRLKVFTLLFQ